MKATGIVRRIDDLGRVVVPKEIRRTLRIREGDPLEIFTDREGEIILKKYSPIGELGTFSKEYADSLAQTLSLSVCIADRDQIIATAGGVKKGLQGKNISKQLETVIKERKLISAYKEERDFVPLTDEDDDEVKSEVISPIISEGDAIGAVIIYDKEHEEKLGETEEKIAMCASAFLGRQMEQ